MKIDTHIFIEGVSGAKTEKERDRDRGIKEKK